jgi:hypothetical protein
MRNLCLTVIFLMINITLAISQQSAQKGHARLQKELSWKQYQKTWFKAEIKKLKEIGKSNKSDVKTPKLRDRRVSKLQKLRLKNALITARKEASDV